MWMIYYILILCVEVKHPMVLDDRNIIKKILVFGHPYILVNCFMFSTNFTPDTRNFTPGKETPFHGAMQANHWSWPSIDPFQAPKKDRTGIDFLPLKKGGWDSYIPVRCICVLELDCLISKLIHNSIMSAKMASRLQTANYGKQAANSNWYGWWKKSCTSWDV